MTIKHPDQAEVFEVAKRPDVTCDSARSLELHRSGLQRKLEPTCLGEVDSLPCNSACIFNQSWL